VTLAATRWRTRSTWASASEAGVHEDRFTAELTDGQSAAAHNVVLGFDAVSLRILDPQGTTVWATWPLAGLEVEDLHNHVIHLQHPSAPGMMIACRDPGLGPALHRWSVPAVSLPRGRRLTRLVFIYAGVLAVVVAGVYAAVPPLSRMLARRVPMELEERLGLELERLVTPDLCQTDAARAALTRLTDRLGRAEGEGPAARDVAIVNWGMVNAFTLPGGKVLLTRGLLEKAAGADEVAGVLAHELEHVRQRHVMAQVIRSSIFSFGWAVTVGDFSGLFVLDPATLFSIANQSFSRTDERSADAGALARLDAAGISREGFAAFFQRIQAETDALPAWLTSHPASRERLARIQSGPALAKPERALSEPEWNTLKAACAGAPEEGGGFRRLFDREK
jgi:beta-barrel assembly-enhancing protease